MRYTTDDMRNYAADASEVALRIGGVKLAMKEAADEIDRLRSALAWIRDELPLRDQDGQFEPHAAHTRRLKQYAIEALNQ